MSDDTRSDETRSGAATPPRPQSRGGGSARSSARGSARSSGRGSARSSGRGSALGLAGLVGAAGLAYLALAVLDIVPGGWRLRTLVVPQAVTDARRRATHREERLAAFAAESEAEARADVVFIGSSTIEFFDLGAAFPGADTSQRGIGDEDLARLELRLEDTLLRARCRWAVVYAGSVDARRPVDDGTGPSGAGPARWVPPGEIASRALAMLERALEGDPRLHIALLEVLPEREDREGVHARIEALNRLLRGGAEAHPRLVWVPTHRPPIVDDAAGRLVPEFSRDRLHLNAAGYARLREWLLEAEPSLREALGG